MPLYTYECPKGHIFETLGRFEDRELPCEVYVEADPAGIVDGFVTHEHSMCGEPAKRIPSMPAPAVFNCPMPTYQKRKEGTP